jgi:fructoselysine transporter
MIINEELKPVRSLNLTQTISIIISTVIGSGVFISLPIIAQIAGSPLLATIIWLLGGLMWLPPILILAEMGTAYPDQGFGYYYLQKARSPFLAFIYTWTCFLTSDTPTLTIVALSAASVLKIFAPTLGNFWIARIFASLLILSFAYLHYRSVKTGGNFQIILTLAKIIPLFAVVVIGFGMFDSNQLFTSSISENNQSIFFIITAGISATAWSYAGFGNILYMAGEVKNPHKTLPIALIGSVIFVMIAYTLISLGTSMIVPFNALLDAKGDFVNPFLYLNLFKNFAPHLFAVVAFISMIGVLSASIMVQPRLEYAMAKDGLFFKPFGKLHPKFLTPHISIMIQAGFAVFIFLLGDIENMLGYFTLSYVLQNTLVYGTIFFLRKRNDYKPTFYSPMWKTMGVLSLLIQIYLVYGTILAYPAYGVLACFGLVLTGLPIYLYFKKRTFK